MRSSSAWLGIVDAKRPEVEPEAAEVDRPDDVGHVGDDERPRGRAVRRRHLDRLQPLRSARRHALLEERLPERAVGEPLQHRRPAPRRAQDRLGDGEVVADEVELGRPEPGKKILSGFEISTLRPDTSMLWLAARLVWARHDDRLPAASGPIACCRGAAPERSGAQCDEVDDVEIDEGRDEHDHAL